MKRKLVLVKVCLEFLNVEANYRLQTKFAKVMFSQVSVCPQGGVYSIACWDTHTPSAQTSPWADTTPRQTPLGRHPLGRHTPLGRHPLGRHPHGQTPPWADILPGQTPPAQCILGYGQQAGSTHPTGMHSCFKLNFF